MDTRPPILISLSSFGAAEVRRHGQRWFTRLAAEAGADGVEVRGELLGRGAESGPDLAPDGAELDAIAETARGLGLQLVYSSPEGLWRDDGAFDDGALARGLGAARRLGAPRLKMSIGGYRADAAAGSLPRLRSALEGQPVELLIENDQTPAAGTLDALDPFFADLAAYGLPLAMTFDMGNWHWLGECPLQAASALGARVGYVHCKGVQRQPQRWVAVPVAESAAPWRAVLRALPAGLPWAIEYPLAGDDLVAVTRHELATLRGVAERLS